MLISKFAEDGTPISQLTSGSCRKVLVRCDGDGCDKQYAINWSNYLQGQKTQDRNGKTYCQPCSAKLSGLKRVGVKAPYVAAANKNRIREKHGSWRGGRYTDKEGYVNVLVTPPSGGSGKYRKEHHLVVELRIGRELTAAEVVHHIDNNKQNNAEANLYLTDSTGHRLAHVSLVLSLMLLRTAGLLPQKTKATAKNAWQAYSDGKIYFDVTQGIYMANLKLRELREHPTGESRGQSAAKVVRNNSKVQRLGHGVQNGQ